MLSNEVAGLFRLVKLLYRRESASFGRLLRTLNEFAPKHNIGKWRLTFSTIQVYCGVLIRSRLIVRAFPNTSGFNIASSKVPNATELIFLL